MFAGRIRMLSVILVKTKLISLSIPEKKNKEIKEKIENENISNEYFNCKSELVEESYIE